MIAFLNIDEVIAIIRHEDNPKQVMIERFAISDQQAEAILDLKLRQIAKLEEIKIREEQEKLNEEREKIEKILGSMARLKTLVIKELKQDAETFGDDRRSQIVTRSESKAMNESDLLSSDPVTVVLSEKGWARAAKGHDVDPTTLNYKAGDAFKAAAKGRSNQLALFLDSMGRSYAIQAHTLPSARGQGEPLSGRLNPASGATFEGILMGEISQKVLLASDAGYGFVGKLEDLITKNKAGKAVLKCPVGAKVLQPSLINDPEKESIAAVSNEGRLLLFPLSELPELARGKGNKIIGIPAARVANREEFVISVAVLGVNDSLVIYSGKRHLTLKPSDLKHYNGERGRRGNKLPRGFQKVDSIDIEVKEALIKS